MIYVYPMGYQCYYVNKYDGSFDYMDMFAQELVPHIDATLRTIPDRQHRSITGYSMGGFGAYVLAAKHPEIFLCSAPLSMSFRTDQQYMTESSSGWNNQWGSLFGGKGEKGEARLTDYYKEHCPYYVFNEDNRASLETVKWFFTCGDDEEQLLIANDSLHVLLRDRGFAHEYRVGNGAHTSKYWMDALNEVLTMFSFYMNGREKWPGRNIEDPRIPDITTDTDGVYRTEEFTENGTLVLVAYKDIDRIGDVIAELSRGSGFYVLLPCNLAVKSLADWKETWLEKYSGTNMQIVAIGDAGEQALALQDQMKAICFIDARLGESITPVKTCKYVILNTDNGNNYRDMGALYTACKRGDCSFEYRVVKATQDPEKDILRLIETNKTLFNF
jgi:esterase/lipase superfamily enzyme